MARIFGIITLFFLKRDLCWSVQWEEIRCASDTDQTVPEGLVDKIGRFPWLGIIQHTFYMGGKSRFAVTTAILIHPAYVISSAEDIARISPDMLRNNTKFIAWQSATNKYSLDVQDYMISPEYEEDTHATLALLELVTFGETGVSDFATPILPVCMPVSGSGSFDDIYAVKLNDDSLGLKKETRKMAFVSEKDCTDFYDNAQLNYKKMQPMWPLCAKVASQSQPCVWDGGVALITRQSWGHWKLLGFGVRGPGCGAPARFINIHDYLPWIDDVITDVNPEDMENTYKIIFRRQNPHKITMYSAGRYVSKNQGQCERGQRGSVLYKDNSELLSTKNFAQGFFYVSVSQVASFMCATVILETQMQSNVAMWVEHNCHRDVAGIAHGMNEGPDFRRLECFLYFKSTAFIEFRFFFSFRATIEMTIFGFFEDPRRIPNPFVTTQTTDTWEPTNKIIRWGNFMPYYKWWYYL